MTTGSFEFVEGRTPLLVSVPHDGRELAPGMPGRMTAAAKRLPDTDWHVAKLYRFARDLGASVLTARYSRYVVDLNRPPDDASLYPGQLATGLCPSHCFDGTPIYGDGGAVSAGEQAQRVLDYWQPYHSRIAAELKKLKSRFGHALLWDAHSIASRVPALFDGELPVLNIGTNGGAACAEAIAAAVCNAAQQSDYGWVRDGRFRGGYITRHYGQPASAIHAVQLELAQRSYMNEESLGYDEQRAARLQQTLRNMLEAFLDAAA